MKCFSMILRLLVICTLFSFQAEVAYASWVYGGHVSNVETSGEGCAELLAAGEFEVEVFEIPRRSRRLAAHFRLIGEPNTGVSILPGTTLVGRFGGGGDVILTKSLRLQERDAQIYAEGVISAEVLLVGIEVRVFDPDPGEVQEEPRCLAKAEFFGRR